MAASTENSKYITLVSNDEFEYVVLREATSISPVIKSMLDPTRQFLEAKTSRCVFPEIKYVWTDIYDTAQCNPFSCDA